MKKNNNTEKNINAVIYARRSSDRQNEESTSQQIAVCKDMANRLGYNVIRVFADEGITGKTDRRPEFQKMVRAVDAGKCDVVIAYKSNRIARNMLQALTYEARFEKSGVKILYAKEEFGDNAAGRFALRNMMNLNQFYSENMSEDIKRSLYTYAEECKVLNGRIPLGYVKGADGKYALATDGSVELVQEIFQMYCNGIKSNAICKMLNNRGLKTAAGKKFRVGTIDKILHNRKYIGVYTYGNVEIKDGCPRIVDDLTFEKAQKKLSETHRAPAAHWSAREYLLTGKLFCGNCGASMIGESGVGRNGSVYSYYCCYNRKKNLTPCKKNRIRQNDIETEVIRFTIDNVLTDEIIDKVAEEAIKLQENDNSSMIHQQHITQLAEVRKKINNIVEAIADGFRTPALKEQLDSLTEEENELTNIIENEKIQHPSFTKDQLVTWMTSFRTGNLESPRFRKQIIDIFINSIYLYDDHYTITYNTGETREALSFSSATELESSNLNTFGPPNRFSSKHLVYDGLVIFQVPLIS